MANHWDYDDDGDAHPPLEPERDPKAVDFEVAVLEGKFTFRYLNDGSGEILRHGQPWVTNAVTITGARAIYALASELHELRKQLGLATETGPRRADPSGYGEDIGASSLVAAGRVIQIGSRPNRLDAHVRANCMVLRCEPEQGDGGENEQPMEFSFNDEDAEILMRAAAVAARKSKAYVPPFGWGEVGE